MSKKKRTENRIVDCTKEIGAEISLNLIFEAIGKVLFHLFWNVLLFIPRMIFRILLHLY